MIRSTIADITQLVSWPARSGVQRLLLELFRHWPTEVLPIELAFESEGSFFVMSPPQFSAEMDRWFSNRDDDDQHEFRSRLCAIAERHRDPRGIVSAAPAYFLPEPTYNKQTLSRVRAFYDSGRPTFSLVMDALPALKPSLFPGRHQGVTDEYFRLICALDHVAFISENARQEVEGRLRRRPFEFGLVATPGSDGLSLDGHPPMRGSHFIAVGTVEPRKRTGLILDAMAQVAADGREIPLVVIGAPGSDLAAVTRLENAPEWVTWIKNAHDQEVAIRIASARGMIFVGSDEGYGLPPLEALHLGCPVIVGSDLPALRGLSPLGQIRLPTVTVESVSDAVRSLNRENVNAPLRRELARLELPRWRTFAHRLATWAAAAIAASA